MTTLTLAEISQLHQLTFFVFVSGLITGVVCAGTLKTLISIFTIHYQVPRRIKTSNGYLYRFKNIYVPLDERNKLRQQAIEKYRALRNEKKTSS